MSVFVALTFKWIQKLPNVQNNLSLCLRTLLHSTIKAHLYSTFKMRMDMQGAGDSTVRRSVSEDQKPKLITCAILFLI